MKVGDIYHAVSDSHHLEEIFEVTEVTEDRFKGVVIDVIVKSGNREIGSGWDWTFPINEDNSGYVLTKIKKQNDYVEYRL